MFLYDSLDWDMIYFIRAILLATIAVNGIFIVLAVRKLKDGAVYKLLFVHLCAIVIWAGSILICISLPDLTGVPVYTPGTVGHFFSKTIYIGAALMIASQLWFVKFFQSEKPVSKAWKYGTLAFIALIVIIACIDNALFYEVTIQPNGSSDIVRGPLTPLYSLYTLLFLVWPNVILYRKWKKSQNLIVKNQLKILFSSYVLFEGISVLTNWILPVYLKFPAANAIGPAFSLVLAFGMSYASSHYRLLDFRLSLQRVLTYISAGGIIGVVVLYIFFSQSSLSKIDLLLIDTITVLIALIAFSGLTRILSPLFNLIIFRKASNYLETLRQAAVKISSSSIGVGEAVEQITATIQSSLGLKQCSLVFASEAAGGYSPLSRDEDNGNSSDKYPSRQSSLIRWLQEHNKDAVVKDEIEYDLLMRSGHDSPVALQEIKNEMEQYYAAVAIPITDNHNNLVAVLLLDQKIDREYFSTQEIRELKLFLQHMTFYIYNAGQYLELQNKLHDKALVEKEFMKGLFHEVRTPLTIAQSSIEALQWAENNQERQEYIGKATSQIQRSSHILSDFSDILALEQGKIKLYMSPIPFEYVLQNALARIEPLRSQKETKIVYKNKSLLKTVIEADIDRLSNALTQILDNAVRYHAGEKVPQITITLASDKQSINLMIHDNGSGISEEDISRIFDKFYKSDKARNIHQGGPGLGLSYAKAVLEAHGGKIEIVSSPKKGTSVSLTIPLKQGIKSRL